MLGRGVRGLSVVVAVLGGVWLADSARALSLCGPMPPGCIRWTCINGDWVESGFKAAGTACDDRSACTTGDICDGKGTCVGTPLPGINDGNPCTTDSCNASTGAITHTPLRPVRRAAPRLPRPPGALLQLEPVVPAGGWEVHRAGLDRVQGRVQRRVCPGLVQLHAREPSELDRPSRTGRLSVLPGHPSQRGCECAVPPARAQALLHQDRHQGVRYGSGRRWPAASQSAWHTHSSH